MEPGIRKVLKTRPATETKSDESPSMDVDYNETNEVRPDAQSTPNSMDVTSTEATATTTASTSGEAEVASSPPPAVVQPTAEELRLMRLRRFGGPAPATPTITTEAPKPTESPAKLSAATRTLPMPTSTSSQTMSIDSSPASSFSSSGGLSSGLNSSRLTPAATPFNTPSHTPVEHSPFLSTSPNITGHMTSGLSTPQSKPSSTSTTPSSSVPTSVTTSSGTSTLHHPGATTPQPFDLNTWIHKTISNAFSVRGPSNVSAPLGASSFGSSDSNPSKTHIFDMSHIIADRASTSSAPPAVPSSPNSMQISERSPASAATNTSPLFTMDDIDLILMGILSTPQTSLPNHFNFFEFMAHSLSRLDALKRTHPVSATTSVTSTGTGNPPMLLAEMITRAHSYLALALSSPLLFPIFSAQLHDNPEYASSQFVRVLGKGLLTKEHLTQLVLTIGEEKLPAVFEPIFMRCAALARMHSAQVQFDAASQSAIHAFKALVGVGKPLVNVLVHHPRFNVKSTDTGQAVDLTLLGCLFTYTPLFALGRTETEGAMVSLPTVTIGEIFFDVVNGAKDATLDWIATAILKNKDATKMGGAETISSTGFANSFSTAMLKMAKPFMDRVADKGRFANYDPNYLTRSKRLSSMFDSSDTHIVADKQAFEAWRTEISAQPNQPTFITECFHMTLLSLILQARTYRIYADVFERLADMKRQQAALGGDHPNIDNMARVKAILEDVIFAPSHFQEAFLFWEMVGVWLARVASTPDGQTISGSTRFDPPQLPLPQTPPKAYQCLPEIILETYASFFMFAALYWEKFSDQVHTDIMNSLVTLLASPQYVKNPHIRVKMVQVLTVLMPRNKGGRLQPTRLSPFDSNFVVSNLGPALTHLYCDVERTGSASQFYDRLNARHELSSILVFLWTDRPGHKEAIVSYWDLHPESFKSFADKLLNDSIFLLDEGLSKLFESRGAQQRLESGVSSESERRELKETMDRAARQTVSYMVLLKESLRIFSMIALNHPRLFMNADMHERLATSLNYCLYQVHGPRRNELAFTNQEKYQFEPAWVVDKLCSSILSFATFDKTFIDFLVRDTRSYSEELYTNAAAFIERSMAAGTGSGSEFEFKSSAWKSMLAVAKEHTQQVEEYEDQLGDIPDEFLDPLMATLMTDPVILPSSRITLDRQVIERALLADPIDPYNRSPLTADQLIPDTELKAKIDAFIAEKRKKK